MNPFIILSIFLFSIFSDLSAQINIEANTFVSGQKFLIEINSDSLTCNIILKVREGISANKEYEKKMERYREKFFALEDKSVKNDSAKQILQEMEVLAEENTVYSIFKTEFFKTENKNFDNLVKLFKIKKTEFFEKRERNRNRITFDGTLVKIVVNNDGSSKTIWSHWPTEQSHPEIKNLITSSLEILREKKILSTDKKLTAGY